MLELEEQGVDVSLLERLLQIGKKRTIPLPPTRIPKKELTSIFSHSDDSEESDKGNGQHPEVKQEEDLHINIMKRRYFPASCWHCKSKGTEMWAVGEQLCGLPMESPPGLEIQMLCPIGVEKEQWDPFLWLFPPL
uniref:Uncharacterized protein n=1 Tax=Meleagris gallopavo TaxID=9103 RepID=A0A803XQ91_MELGA